MIIEDQLLSIIKPNIDKGNLEGLCQLYNETDFGRELAWDYIFQKMYFDAPVRKSIDNDTVNNMLYL
jgi:hypothetical protein